MASSAPETGSLMKPHLATPSSLPTTPRSSARGPSTRPRRRPMRVGRSSRRWSPSSTASTTPRSSPRCTRVAGRAWKGTFPGTVWVSLRAGTCWSNGSTASWYRCTRPMSPYRRRSSQSRTGAARPSGSHTRRGAEEPGGLNAPSRASLHPRRPDRRRLRAHGQWVDAGLRDHAGDQRGAGRDGRARRLPELLAVLLAERRPVCLHPHHRSPDVRVGSDDPPAVHSLAPRTPGGAIAAGDMGHRPGRGGRAVVHLYDQLPIDDYELLRKIVDD